jgi:nicotinamide-nucleotide amidase
VQYIKNNTKLTAEIISIGDELLIGQTINTNASWIGQQLALIGIKVKHVATISDDKQAIVSALNDAHERNNLIVITGGLGPTKDDITKHVLCDYFETKLVMNSTVLAHIEAFFSSRNRPMLQVNTDQALLPESCEVLFNKFGTAAGMWFEKEGRVYMSMPGVPYEMKTIFEEEALPKITQNFNTAVLYHRTFLTQGIGESFLAQQLADWEDKIEAAGMQLAYLPAPGLVKMRITSFKGETDAQLIQSLIDEVKMRMPAHFVCEGEMPIAALVGELLKANGKTVGTVESCTGGNIAAAFVANSGSSDYFEGSLLTYTIDQKVSLADVPRALISEKGVVSKEVAEAMALGGLKKLKTDYCIATTGIVGPTGETATVKMGTVWIAVARNGAVSSKMHIFGDNRERNIQMCVLTALNFLRCELLEINQ